MVTKVVMDNKASAKLDDLLTITTTINRLKSASVVFSQQACKPATNITLCTAEIKVACVDLSIVKPCIIPEKHIRSIKTCQLNSHFLIYF